MTKYGITQEQALAALPDGDIIHVCSGDGIIIGADWSREEVLTMISQALFCQIAGPFASSTGHGLAIWTNRNRVWFVEAKREVMDEYLEAVESGTVFARYEEVDE